MRLLIKLRAEKRFCYDPKYYSKLRGFLYEFQKDSKLFNRHDLKGYKYFCYSNIFPAEDVNYGETRTFVISCPCDDFIYWLRGKFTEMQELSNIIEIGEMQFKIDEIKTFKPTIKNNMKLITGTPIVMRIPKERYKEYGIESNRNYEYWRAHYDFDAFIKQLSDNLIKKYNEFYGTNIEEKNLFETFEFKKEVCVHRIEEGKEIQTIGTLWEFGFSQLNKQQRDILWLGLESGFGELNSTGFGFMNKVVA